MAQFTVEVWAHGDEPGSWHFVTLPPEAAEEIRAGAGPPRGFGSVRVSARIGATSWRTSVFPESGGGSFVLPVKRAVRTAEGLEAGDACTVEVTVLG
jgi:hypothetical protein